MLKEYAVFKAAAVQAAPVFKDRPVYFDSRATLAKAVDLIAEAARNGAKLIVFPETFLPGFPYWSLNMTKGPEWSGIWAEYLRHSVEVPGEETDILCRAARSAGACVAMGINERDRKYEGRMYNSILFISHQGEVMGVHRKINPTIQELLYHTRGDGGANLKVFDTPLGKISGLVCGEHYQPLLKQNLILQGAQVNCSLWPGFKGGAGELMTIIPVMTQALCVSGALWAVLACSYIPESQVPRDFYGDDAFDQTFGGSCIINPFGEIVAGPEINQETIVYGDIDLKVNVMAKSIINLTGSYSRWDILGLGIREKQYEPVFPLEIAEEAGPASPDIAAGELAAKVRLLEERLRVIEQANAGEGN
ncbi:MAG: carbon-nitrogen hydrolase family protein [Chloroflexota bacterium]